MSVSERPSGSSGDVAGLLLSMEHVNPLRAFLAITDLQANLKIAVPFEIEQIKGDDPATIVCAPQRGPIKRSAGIDIHAVTPPRNAVLTDRKEVVCDGGEIADETDYVVLDVGKGLLDRIMDLISAVFVQFAKDLAVRFEHHLGSFVLRCGGGLMSSVSSACRE